MRPRNDDDADMNTHRRRLRGLPGYGTRDAGSQLSAGDALDAELEGIVDELRELSRIRVPTPSPELQTMLLQGTPSRRHRWTRKRTVIVGAMLTGSMTMGLTSVAAATDRLPGTSQNVVAGVIDDLTPFHIDNRHPRPRRPANDDHDRPVPSRLPPSDDHDAPGRGPGDGDSDADGQPPLTAMPRPTLSEHEPWPGDHDRESGYPHRSSWPTRRPTTGSPSPSTSTSPTEHESIG